MRTRVFAACAALALLTLGAAPAWAPAHANAFAAEKREVNDEYSLKAAFLFKFARYVSWPQAAQQFDGEELIVAVVGKNPFGKKLEETLEGKRVGARRVRVKFFKSVRTLEACHILYVPAAEERHLATIRKENAGRVVLIVAESIAAAQRGAHIGFYLDKSRVRFAINETCAQADRLEVSSELLKLAKLVKSVQGAGE